MQKFLKNACLCLASAAVMSVAFTDAQPAMADCGKMVVVYYVWPTPPPPPPKPQPSCYVQQKCDKKKPARKPYKMKNSSTNANETYQNAGRDAININVTNNTYNLPSASGVGTNSSVQDWNPLKIDSINEENYKAWIEKLTSEPVGTEYAEETVSETTTTEVTEETYAGWVHGATQETGSVAEPEGNDTGFFMGPDDSFEEPNQQGVVAWNEDKNEEILILSTNEKSTLPAGTAMLSILPLPGKPISVERANAQSFVVAKDLMNDKIKADGEDVSMGVVYENKIGSHNIFVWEVESTDDFQGKVQAYIAGKYDNKAAALITPNTLGVIKKYLDDGFRYFAFDLTIVDKDFATKEAIAYRFESKYAYFPLRISQVGGLGESLIDLVVLSRGNIVPSKRSGIQPGDPNFVVTKSFNFTTDELKQIDESLFDLYGAQGSVLGREVLYRTEEIDSFNNDFEAVKMN